MLLQNHRMVGLEGICEWGHLKNVAKDHIQADLGYL